MKEFTAIKNGLCASVKLVEYKTIKKATAIKHDEFVRDITNKRQS